METNEKRQEKVNNTAKIRVNSSIKTLSVLSAMCNEVITKRQNPSKLAEVFKICCEVLFAIIQK
jgi:hypothetical protein